MPAATSPSPLRRLRGLSGGLLTAAAVALAAAVLLPALLGFQRYVITSGSMTGTYDRGSLVYDRVVPTSSLKVGDVITYAPPRGRRPGRPGHPPHPRDHDAAPTAAASSARRATSTRSVDPWTFTLQNRTQAAVAFHLPYVGFALAALADRSLRMLIIGIPALLVALSVLAGLWREAGETAAEGRRA